MSRPFPRGEEALIAFDVIEWACDSMEAHALDAQAVLAIRVELSRPLKLESEWRRVYDLALSVWAKGYAAHLARQGGGAGAIL